VLTEAAGHDVRARRLIAGFDAANVSERDRAVFVEYLLQTDLGDPSPAVTVGAVFGLQAANVRQIVKRTRTRLAGPARTDDICPTMGHQPILAS
jgi:DNA-directed RNA polymerase sigma subunit (sigma70/sigma32)